jgi:GLPGLI family protein
MRQNKFEKKSFILIVTMLVSALVIAQTGKVVYKITLNEANDFVSPTVIGLLENEDKKPSVLNYTLYWDERCMKFLLESSDEIPESDKEVIQQLADAEGIFYKKVNDFNVYRQIPNTKYYNSIICKRKYYTHWRFFDEKKMISGYECKKAECILGLEYGDGEINYTYPITAWYSPKLKNQIGPSGIGGLPGVILELKQLFVTLTASEVVINKETISVTFPEDIKIIHEKDLTSFIEKSTVGN